jgi:hypothetical protein
MLDKRLFIAVIFSLLSGAYLGFWVASQNSQLSAPVIKKASTSNADKVLFVWQPEQNVAVLNIDNSPIVVQPALAAYSLKDIAQIIKLPGEFAQYSHTYQLAAQLNEAQLVSRLQTVRGLADIHDVIGLSKVLLSRYVQMAPQKATAYFFAHYGSHPQHTMLIQEVYHEWAFVDPAAAASHVEGLTGEQHQEDIILSLVGAPVFANEPQIQQLSDLLSPQLQQQAQYIAIRNQPHEDAFRAFLLLPKGDPKRHSGLRRTLFDWARKDPKAVLAHLNELDNPGDVREYQRMVISVLARNDAQQAIEEALKLDAQKPGKNRELLMMALEQVALKDGKQAFELANDYPQLMDNKVKMQLLASWARNDPRAAVEYWQNDLAMVNKDNAYSIADAYAQKYPQEALQWASNSNLPKHILRTVGNIFARKDLAQAQNYLTSVQAPEQRQLLIAAIAQQKSQLDIDDARQWLSQFENESGYTRANEQLMHTWIEQDPEAASAQILYEEKGHQYVTSLVHSWYRSDPQSTRLWIVSIDDNGLRDKALTALIPKVIISNTNLAEDLLKNVTNPGIRRSLQKQIESYLP